MDHNDQQVSQQNKLTASPQVLLVQPAVDHHMPSIDVVDIYSFLISKFKWFVALLLFSFVLVVSLFMWQNQQRNYQQMIQLPSIVGSNTMQRVPLLYNSDLINEFNLNDVRYWMQNPNSVINKTFKLIVAKPGYASTAATINSNYLMLTMNASSKNKKRVAKLFNSSLQAITGIVESKVALWVAGMHQKIKSEQAVVNYLSKVISSKKANGHDGDDYYVSQRLLQVSQLQSQIVAAHKLIDTYQWQLASLQNKVMFKGPLLQSRPESVVFIIIKGAVVALILSIIIMFIISMLTLNIVHFKGLRTNNHKGM